eukprot:TRINITY_DN5740_c0_g1_i2.p1 TRINITY_DN5740_c0_g1~~TRINITY_DN5740_c0_g1_i2.p1  ORF type:complete len:511 (-),score=103.54 TRINITY_DN5740_c0_g1_i2:28-1560(-)
MANPRGFFIILFVFQVVLIALFAIFASWDESTAANNAVAWGWFRDVSVMCLVGFGFLMLFLRKYLFGAVGFTFLVTTLGLQWALLTNAFFSKDFFSSNKEANGGNGDLNNTFLVGVEDLTEGLFAVAAVLITFGGVIGKISPAELYVVAILEIALYSINNYVCVPLIGAVDVGGSIVIHTFGAAFGVTLAWIISPPASDNKSYELNASAYVHDVLALLGSLFLWIYWPSFNASTADPSLQGRVVLNTVVALAASSVISFALSRVFSESGKLFSMVDIQNATLAGGVAVGTCSDLPIGPGGAAAIGALAGIINIVGYHYTQPWLASRKYALLDTCGIVNLHLQSGILGALASVVVCFVIGPGNSLYGKLYSDSAQYPYVVHGGSTQAIKQLQALVVTLAISIVGGAVCGLVMVYVRKSQTVGVVTSADDGSEVERLFFADEKYWEVPDNYKDFQQRAPNTKPALLRRQLTFNNSKGVSKNVLGDARARIASRTTNSVVGEHTPLNRHNSAV